MTINEKIQKLREEMQREHLAAYIFTSTDPHNGEYVPEHWKSREWISGFDGSAGTAVVTMTSAALWTDSRYFLAAEEQLRGTEFQLMKLKMPETPTIPQWIHSQLTMNNEQFTEIAIDGSTNSAVFVEELIEELRKEGGLKVDELAERTCMPVKTCYRIVDELSRHGLVAWSGEEGGVVPTPPAEGFAKALYDLSTA